MMRHGMAVFKGWDLGLVSQRVMVRCARRGSLRLGGGAGTGGPMGKIAGVRRTGNPHWMAVLATVFVGATILVANLDGYHNQLFGADTTIADDPRSGIFNWAHGWPWPFMVRHSIYPLSGAYTGNRFTGPIGFNGRWPFDSARVHVIGLKPILLDCVCWTALILGTAYGAQRLGGWWNPQNSFGLKTLFVATAVVAAGTYFGPSLLEDDSRDVLYYITLSVAGAAAVLTLFSVADIALRMFRLAPGAEAAD